MEELSSPRPLHAPDDELARLRTAQHELGRKLQEARLLGQLTERLNAGTTLDELADYVYETFRAIVPYDRIGLALLEDGGTTVQAKWARCDYAPVEIEKGFSQPIAGSSLEQIITSGRPRILNDLAEYLEARPQSVSTRRLRQEGIRSSLTCPLLALGRPIGFLFFSSRQAGTYAESHVELLMQIAGHLSIAVEKTRLLQQLTEANDARARLLGVVAHDLRNPLQIVRSSVDVLRLGRRAPLTDHQRTIADRISSTCRRMERLVDDLLDVSVVETGRIALDLQSVDVTAYLTRVAEASRPLAQEKEIAFELAVTGPLPLARFDPIRIEQVLGNLVTNGLKFSKPGTRLTLGALARADRIEIRVADQGQGIPAHELPALLLGLRRASVRPTHGEKSVGLGLAIARGVVEAHGGRLWVESEVGRGSTFTFCLPLAGPPGTRET